MENFIVSARKYRPSTFETLIGQDSIAVTLKNSIKRGQLAHAYLFCGPRGVGKTTTARIFAKIINCLNPGENMEPCSECESCKSFDEGRSYCIHELDAASNNSVDDIRALTEKVMIPPQVGKYSVYIIDEVHMLSTAAFNAFLKTLEEPPAHAIFILATTEKQKIIPTILSRCQVYDFSRISVSDIVKNLKYIANKEGVTIGDNSLHVIAQKADGAMRDALTLFDQVVAFCSNNVKYEDVIKNLNVLNHEYYFQIVYNSLQGKFAENLVIFDEVLNKGFNPLYFVGGLSNHFRNLLICKESVTAKLLEVSDDTRIEYENQATKCALPFLFKALSVCEKCETEYTRSNNQRLLVEFMLVRISQLQPPQKIDIQPTSSQGRVANDTERVISNVSEHGNVPTTKEEVAQEPKITQEQTVAQESSALQDSQTPIVSDTSANPEATPATSPTETASDATEATLETTSEATSEATPTTSPTDTDTASVATATDTSAYAHINTPTQAPQPPIANIVGINSIIKDKDNHSNSNSSKESEDALGFMGPSHAKPFGKEELKRAWLAFADDFEKKQPNKVPRFVAAVRQTEPLIAEDNRTVIFKVANVDQKEWIERYAAPKIVHFLRNALSNNTIELSVEKLEKEEIKKSLYLPQEKDEYMTQNNSELKNLKEDLGAEIINGQ